MKLSQLILTLGLALASSPAFAAGLSVDLKADAHNPQNPQMGDHLTFHSVISNTDQTAHDGIIAWLSLVQIDKGKEQPVDLEDWSAHKAITEAQLKPGASITTEWPVRLIQSGNYRVVVSTVTRDGVALTPSPFVDFSVRVKPVVESSRVLPVAFGIPGLLAAMMIASAFRRRQAQIKPS